MQNINISNVWHMDYWFKQPDIAVGFSMWFFVLFFLGLVLAGLILKFWRRYKTDKLTREIMRRFSNLGLTVGLLGVAWMFFRQEHILLLAWRFWLLVLAMIYFWWLSKVLRYTIKRVPELRMVETDRARVERYLPGKN